jgi:hypothetical protein
MDPDVLTFAAVMLIIVSSTASLAAIGLGTRTLWHWGSRRERMRDVPRDDDGLQRLETAVDTIAIEVERISEAQRFMVGLLGDALPAQRAERVRELGAPGRVITPH